MNDVIIILVLAVAISFVAGMSVERHGWQPKAGGKKPRAPRTGSGVEPFRPWPRDHDEPPKPDHPPTAGYRPPIEIIITHRTEHK
jgi:hypothetical protein